MNILEERNIMQAVQKFLEKHKNSQDSPVTVALCSASGECVFLLKMAKAPQLSYDIAINKAKTSAVMKVTTRAFHERLVCENLSIADFCGSGTTGLTGGVPIFAGGEIAGGIGVSGCKPEHDEELAYELLSYLTAGLNESGNSDLH